MFVPSTLTKKEMSSVTVSPRYDTDESQSTEWQGLQSVEGRLLTYRTWKGAVEPTELAEAGFYYLQGTEKVRCAFCNVTAEYTWLPEDDPVDHHWRWSLEQRKYCNFLREKVREQLIPEDKRAYLEKFGVIRRKGPVHSRYAGQQTRFESFKQWPKVLRQISEELASAGFFYRGFGDQTLCFYCGGGLKDWERNDDPWEQHAKWFPKCSYLLMRKGPLFVKAILEKKEPEVNSLPSTSDGSINVDNEKPHIATVSGRKSQYLCKICFEDELCIVFLPCRHIIACVDCAIALTDCPVCRQPLEATVRAFLT